MSEAVALRLLSTLVRRLEGRRCWPDARGGSPKRTTCATRTIRPDLEALEAAGFPLVEVEHRWHLFDWPKEVA